MATTGKAESVLIPEGTDEKTAKSRATESSQKVEE